VPNPELQLLPGMLAAVHFELGASARGPLIPRRAVQREFDLSYVFVLEAEEGEADVAVVERRRVDVRPVAFRPNLLDVGDGLRPGERIAVSGVTELRAGQRVQVREREASAPDGIVGS